MIVLDVEVLSALRRLELGGLLTARATTEAVETFRLMQIVRHDMELLASQVWELRHRFTTYDATYIALAEGMDAPLVTCDEKLARAGHQARVIVPRTGGT